MSSNEIKLSSIAPRPPSVREAEPLISPPMDISELPPIGRVQEALEKNEDVKETKKQVGKWLLGIGTFAAVTLAGILAAGTVLAVISNPVGWAIGIGIAVALIGVGLYLVAKNSKKWTDAAVPMLIGAATGVIVVCVALILMASKGQAAAGFSGFSGFHTPHLGYNSGLLLWYCLLPRPPFEQLLDPKEETNKKLLENMDLGLLKGKFSDYLNEMQADARQSAKIYEELRNRDREEESLKKIYQRATSLIRQEKYKKAAPLLFEVQEKAPRNALLKREFIDVVALAYPHAAHLQLENMKNSPYFNEEGNPQQALLLAKSLDKMHRREDAKHVLSFAYSIAYKENSFYAKKGEGHMSAHEMAHYNANKRFMSEANLLARTLFVNNKNEISLPA